MQNKNLDSADKQTSFSKQTGFSSPKIALLIDYMSNSTVQSLVFAKNHYKMNNFHNKYSSWKLPILSLDEISLPFVSNSLSYITITKDEIKPQQI